RPGQRLQREPGEAREQRLRDGLGVGRLEREAAQEQGAEAILGARSACWRALLPDDGSGASQVTWDRARELLRGDGRREQDARVALAVVELGHREELLARERVLPVEDGAAAGGEQVPS